MGFRDQVKKPEGAAAAAPAAKAPPARTQPTAGRPAASAGRYSGLKPAEERSPFLEAGKHRVKFIITKEVRTKAKPPWLKTEVEILSTDNDKVKVGAHRTIRKVLTEEAFVMSGPEILSMLMAALGFESTDMGAFEAEYPNWSDMLDAVHGVSAAEAEHGVNPLRDMTAIVNGYETEPNEQGRTFVNCSWSPDPEREE